MKPITKNTLLILLLFILLAAQFFSCKKSDEKLEELIVGEWEEHPDFGLIEKWNFDREGYFTEFDKVNDHDSVWEFQDSASYYINN